MNRQRLRFALKYVIYLLIIFFSFILQCTPGVLELCGVKPLLVLPACLCIAIFEGEYAGGLLGIFGGLLCDFSSDTIFGFNALIFLFLCCAAGLTVIYLVRATLNNALLMALAALFLRALLEFFFSYVIWQYEGISTLFYTYTAPGAVWSAAFTPLYFGLALAVHRAFESEEEKEAGI